MSHLKEQILDRAMKGMARTEIAAELGCTPDTVYGAIVYARRKGVDIPKKKTGSRGNLDPRVAVPRHVLETFSVCAKARDIPVRQLAAELLIEIARSGLVDAVLDDEGGTNV